MDTRPAPDWHALDAAGVLARLDTAPEGLPEEEAAARRARHGPNTLPRPRPVSPWRILADQFASVVVLLLVAAAAVALALGDTLEAVAIAAVLAINTGIGFAVELRARRAMEALLGVDAASARVVRGGVLEVVDAADLVPGDVVELEAGDAVPADARLLEGARLRTSEAALTGESVPVDKSAAPVAADTPLAERTPLVFLGTTVAVGRARAVVVATAADTELGRIGTLLEGIEEEATPLERRLNALGGRLVGLTLAVTAVVVAVGVVQGRPLARMVETGLALAIAAVPEGLPAVATIALAVGLARMARRHALVRRLSAVEALGSTTVVCTDKTGTLTAGEMTVTRLLVAGAEIEVSGVGFWEGGSVGDGADVAPGTPLGRLLRAAALTNRATLDPDERSVAGDPTDAALAVLAAKGGVEAGALADRLPRRGDLPFSGDRMVGASIHAVDGTDPVAGPGGGLVALAKGAPGAVLDRCARVATPDGDVPLDHAVRQELAARNEAWAAEGLRVIAVADGSAERTDPDDVDGLTFLGLVGIHDPPADGVADTIARFRAAGIRTVMITGDQRATGESVARTLGLLGPDDGSLDGRDLRAMDDAALADAVASVGVYSRVSPEDKLRIVAALQARGEIVAMLGDGVNDAVALKKSDVGVAMGGRGTDVAKQTAAVVLQDDRFPTIAAAVEEGRVIFDDIRKFVFYLFSCNLAEILVLLVAALVGLPLPLLPLQILWLNLVTDTFPALALALEPGEPDVMERPPRDPEASILSAGFVRSLLFFALLITGATLAVYLWALGTGRGQQAVTLSFMTLALAQLFHLGNARSRRPVVRLRRILANRWAVAAVPLVLVLQWLSVSWAPLRRVLQTTPLTALEWGVAVGLALVPAVVGQVVEAVQVRRAAA